MQHELKGSYFCSVLPTDVGLLQLNLLQHKHKECYTKSMLIVHTFKVKTINVAKVQHELKGSYFCTATRVRVALVQHKIVMNMGLKFVLHFGNMKKEAWHQVNKK